MMRASISIKGVGLLALIWPGPLFATVQASITGPAYPPPYNFSGTNCGCSRGVATDVGYITSAWLKVGGTTVARYDHQPGGPTYTSVVLSCTFASTHFADGEDLQLAVGGSNSEGESATSQRPPDKVYNKGVVFVRWDFNLPYHYEKVREELQAMNQTNSGACPYWNVQDVLILLTEGTVFHVSSHGSVIMGPPPPGMHQAFQESVKPPNPSSWIIDSQVAAEVQQKIPVPNGPPLYPPYHVVFVNSCSSAGSGNTMAAAFGITNESVDRAFIGWYDDETIPTGVMYANYFWEELGRDRTVWQAREAANVRIGWGARLPEEQQRVSILGDRWTTLDTNRVYTGTDQAAPNGWYHSTVSFPSSP